MSNHILEQLLNHLSNNSEFIIKINKYYINNYKKNTGLSNISNFFFVKVKLK